MILICAWCKKVLGEKEPIEDKTATHGICKNCADKLKKKYHMTEALDLGDIDIIKEYLAHRSPL